MSAHAIYPMDAAIEGSNPAPKGVSEAAPRAWSGVESPWILVASAAAPWPIWSLAAALGVPGASHVPVFSHGVLALAVVLSAMVVWTHRPPFRSALRFTGAILGTGLMGELLANALTDMGRRGGVAELIDPARGLVVWALAFAVYEIAPIVAATSRIMRSEQRSIGLDVSAHVLFFLFAVGAFAWDPTWGIAWRVSPWMAVAVALPFAAARCGPERPAKLPAPDGRGGVLFGIAAIAWSLLALFGASRASVIEATIYSMRWGVEPLEGVLYILPAISLVFALVSAMVLLARARGIRRTASFVVRDVRDGTVTIEEGADEPTSVAIDAGPLPEPGATVTLIGLVKQSPDGGPFRDGAPMMRARRAWVGKPDALAVAMSHRAAGWLLWSAVSAGGILLRLL